MSNAYTELESTVYYFDAKPQALPGALSRFAQFFVAPLCKAGALEREGRLEGKVEVMEVLKTRRQPA